MSPNLKEILKQANSRPGEDREEFAQYAREIETRRTGIYRAAREELRALDEAEQSGVATDAEVEVVFRTFRQA